MHDPHTSKATPTGGTINHKVAIDTEDRQWPDHVNATQAHAERGVCGPALLSCGGGES